MAGKELYTAKEMAEALLNANGMKTIAARNLGCSYKTVVSYINKYVSVANALELSKNKMGDRVESTLLATALGRQDASGDWIDPPNVTALIFLAKTHPAMRERGYIDSSRLEHTGKDGGAIRMYESVSPDDWDSDE